MKKTNRGLHIAAIFVAVFILICLIFFASLYNTDTSASPDEKTADGVLFGSVIFNELMLSNDSAFPDSEGKFYDYAELFNTTSSEISLDGYYILENGNEAPWYFPKNTKIPENGYIIVFFSGDTRDGLYAPMKLSKNGGEIFTIFAPNGLTVDKVVTSETEVNLVYERVSSTTWRKNSEPSPMFPNTDKGRSDFALSRVNLNHPIKITEICAQNLFIISDSDGDFSDYIEITNLGETPINLKNYTISDDEGDFYKWRFPDKTIEGGESILVFASGKNRTNGELHLSFKLAADGENLIFCDNNGILIDKVSYLDLEDGKILTKNGINGIIEISRIASPGFDNSEAGISSFHKQSDAEKPLIINEVMVLNDEYMKQNGEFFDWIEIKNNSNETLNLSDFYLTKNTNNPHRWNFPSIMLAPNETILIYASGNIEMSTKTFVHCDFKLNSQYEELYIFDANEKLIDGVILTEIPYGMSYGRSKRGGFVYISSPTPNEENADGYREISTSPIASSAVGIYDGITSLSIDFISDGKIFYTTDGSEPTTASPLYTTPIIVDKTTVIRAVCYEDGKFQSPISTFSYIINEGHSLPVISLASDPDGLWSVENGICYRGETDENGKYLSTANIYQNWERACSVELFDGEWGFSVDCGLKLFGQSNREYPKQSFQLKFRAKYGYSELYCTLFDNAPEITAFENLVLRSGSQDYRRTMFRDELCTSLVSDLELLVQGYKACVLYINGEYYGIYYIREKIDEHFIASHLDVSPESVDLLVGNGNPDYGSSSDWYSLIWYIQNYDLSNPNNYNYVKNRLDVESFADFTIAQAFFGNRDSGNIKFYRSSETDNKWRWILYDLDYGMTEDYAYSLFFMIDPLGTGYAHKYSTKMINALLQNSEFFDMFLRRFSYHLENSFAADRIISAVDDFKALIRDEIERNIEKWGTSLSSWSWQTTVVKYFVTNQNDAKKTRKQQLIDEIQQLFSLDDETIFYYFYMTEEERIEFDMQKLVETTNET